MPQTTICLLMICVEQLFNFLTKDERETSVSRIDHWKNTPHMSPNEKVYFHEKLGLRSTTPGKSRFCYRKSQFFEEHLIERGSMYDHFALCGSA